MKITFVLFGYPWKPIGGFRVVYEYANHLTERGHEVTIVHARKIKNWKPLPPPNFYYWLRRKAGYIRDLFFTPKVKWQIINKQVKLLYVPELTAKYVPDGDAVFATWWATAEPVMELPASKGEKFYLIQHYEVWGGPKEKIDATWRMPLKKVVIARWLYEKGFELGVPENEMVHIPNGINHRIFQLENPIENRHQRVAMMFSIIKWKGGRDGINALELAKKDVPHLEAVLFGLAHRPMWLPRWIEYKQNPKQTTIVSEIYNRSSIYLCPSWSEGWYFPNTEAMACGCAIVSTDMGGVRDYAIHEKTALLSPPQNHKALARNLIRLLKDDALRIRIAKAGYEKIKEFTWERSTDLLEQFLRQHVKI